MDINWDSRLTKTAGTCSQTGKRDRKTGMTTERQSSIQLSIKVKYIQFKYKSRLKQIKSLLLRIFNNRIVLQVLDSPDRLRDTLVHEMCHAASWIISGYKDGHGPIWKNWAARAMKRFPELPVIARCHSYEIRTKYVYRCQGCAYGKIQVLMIILINMMQLCC